MITKEEFDIRVKVLRRHAPHHPLLPQLGAYSRIACVYLRHAMRGLEVDAIDTARPQVQGNDEERSEYDDTREMEDLQERKGSLYGRRANLSNQFHSAKDRHERANISDEIKRVQLKIGRVQRQIMHLRRTGELLQDDEETPREYTGLALAKREHTVRQNVNRWRKRIAREGREQPDHIQKKWDEKLKNYERELESLRAAIRAEAL